MDALQSRLRPVLCAVFLLFSGLASATSVSFAGFAYAGDKNSIDARFPHVRNVEEALAAEHQPIDKHLSDRLATITPVAYELKPGESLSSLKGSDQAVAMALVLTNETVSTERIGDVTKLLIVLNAQVLFFDFKTQTVLRAYPIDAAYLDAVDRPPDDSTVNSHVRDMLLGEGPGGLLGSFASTVKNAVLPSAVSRYLQITQVRITPEAAADLPSSLTATSSVAETWLADQFDAALLSQTAVPMLPYSKGYAIGNKMAMRFADGDVYTLTLPEPDYAIALELQSFKKVKFGDVPAGTSYIYGAFAHIQITEPLSGHRYLDAAFKNGETKVVPARQSSIDDSPAYQDALEGLFRKLATALAGGDQSWTKAASPASDIADQIKNTQKVLSSCK